MNLYRLACMGVIVLLFSSHTKFKSNAIAADADWTILVFINGDNNLESAAINDFREMARIGSSEKLNVIVQLDLDSSSGSDEEWTQTLRFKIEKGMEPLIDSKLEDIGEANMGDPEVLSDFVSWGMKQYPAKKTALIIWDHGQGYRLFLSTAQSTRALFSTEMKNRTTNLDNRPVRVVLGDPFRSSPGSPYKSCSNDDTNNDVLYNIEIQQALAKSLNGKKLDLIGFDACLMNMVETAFAMRLYGNTLVGSEELEPNEGWNYEDWLSNLSKNTSSDDKELGKILVNSYKKYHTSIGGNSATTLSAINISGFDRVANDISAFANVLRSKLNAESRNIYNARIRCAQFAPNPHDDRPPKDYFWHIDFIQFCDQLVTITKDPEIIRTATVAKNSVKSTVIANYRGKAREGAYGSHGLAIYFPKSNSQYRSDVYEEDGYKKNNTRYPVEFVQKHTWADFLQAYFTRIP